MNRIRLLAVSCTLLALLSAGSAGEVTHVVQVGPQPDLSFRNEVQHAIDRGLAWLLANQNSNGWWSSPDYPALTALPLTAFMGEPTDRYHANPTAAITNGYAWLLASAQPDGSIHRDKLVNYNTSVSMMAFVMARNPAYDDLLRRARRYLIGAQLDLDEPGTADNAMDGGFGYASTNKQADLSNTILALEAIRATERLGRDANLVGARELNWNAAIHFIQNCQNLPGTNKQSWVSTDPKDAGGFIYMPGTPARSMAGGVTNAEGRVALRSYGSISYAGLLSYIYAELKPDDPRVVAVKDWLRVNYTLDENPGMGDSGLYYYLHLMTKGLNAAGLDQIQAKDGRQIDWRHDVAMRLINLQKRDGSWVNSNNRWMEQDPCLITAYSVLSLEMLCRRL
jgi:squalene-hopene/tetraprenyl-beta-curcumene cyclase